MIINPTIITNKYAPAGGATTSVQFPDGRLLRQYQHQWAVELQLDGAAVK